MGANVPFREVITRTFGGRPKMFVAQQMSVAAQTDRDFVHKVRVDGGRRGLEVATKNLGAYAPHLVGEYIWILDDDDDCTLPTFVAGLKKIAVLNAPDAIMVRMDHGYGRILPSARWGKSPRVSEIGVSAFVVRREVWQAHAGAWAPGGATTHSDQPTDHRSSSAKFPHKPATQRD